jgi:hypothetical protein
MKSFEQLSEDIEARRQQARQRQKDQASKFKQTSVDYIALARKRKDKKDERARMKKEIKSELKREK